MVDGDVVVSIYDTPAGGDVVVGTILGVRGEGGGEAKPVVLIIYCVE